MQDVDTKPGNKNNKPENQLEPCVTSANKIHTDLDLINMDKTSVIKALHSNFLNDISGSDEDGIEEVDAFALPNDDDDDVNDKLSVADYLYDQRIDPETQARLETLLLSAGCPPLPLKGGKSPSDPEVLKQLTSSVTLALDEAAAALTKMRAEQQQQQLMHQQHQHQLQQRVDESGCSAIAEAYGGDGSESVRSLLAEGGSDDATLQEQQSLLALACSAGYLELVQVLLAMNAAVDDRGKNKNACTPLMEAASGGYLDIVRMLIAHNADVNAQSSAGSNSPLHYAAAGGHVEVVQTLLDSGANLEEHNENGHTPLMEAASAGSVETARLLLQAGAGIKTHSNEFKESALTLACYKGHLSMVKFLLEAGADQEHKTDEMHTALMEASMDGHTEVARLLLDSGAQVNMPADSFESPLTLAACGGHVDLAILLIERGANLEEVNDEGYTPLMEAAREGHEEMVAVLLAHGADINAQTEETQETALTLACCGGFLEVVDFFVKAGANVELGCSTPLMEAAQEGHLDVVEYLVHKAGANVHAKTSTGDSALTYACENGHTEVAQMLLDAGAELEHESEGGRTPLMKAARAGHLVTVQFLINKGADVNRQTSSNDHTVLSLACAGGHVTVVDFLLTKGCDASHKLKDGSTMLIEAAKGGHSAVVSLLIDWPRSHETLHDRSQQPLNADSSSSSSCSSELPRVPLPGLNNIVPRQDPNCCGGSEVYVTGNPSSSLKKPSTDQIKANVMRAFKRRGDEDCDDEEGRWHQQQQILEELKKVEQELQQKPRPDDQRLIEQLHQLTTARKRRTQQHNGLDDSDSSQHSSRASSEDVDLSHVVPALTQLAKPSSTGPGDKSAQTMLSMFQQALAVAAVSEDVLAATSTPPEGEVNPQQALQHQRMLLEHKQQLQAQLQLQKKLQNELQQQLKLQQEHQALQQQLRVQQALAQRLPDGSKASATSKADAAALLQQQQQQQQSMQLLEQQQLKLQQVQTSIQEQLRQLQSSGQLLEPPPSVQQPRPIVSAEGSMRPPLPPPVPHELMNNPLNQTPLPPHVCPNKTITKKVANKKKVCLLADKQGSIVTLGLSLELDAQTESNHDTALTLAAAGGHGELVSLLLSRGAKLEHSDKKGFTALILAATAGHVDVVDMLLNHGSSIEAMSERTKDTPLSLACSGGRYEVVELLLSRGANKEHRNVSDYTPLSLAASGGYVNIIRLLLHHGAEINSRTGSKLGISPLMLAAMNGHTQAVKLLLDMGSDINAQIETNKNTALTLACFQGRHEVVSLLVERKANIEHRAKTGLTPLMEAASGGYVEVGRILLERGADVNASPVPSSRDTALTIAADKGHCRFVELLLSKGVVVDSRNKKGNTPLWLASNGGHLDVVMHLVTAKADVDAQDNRKVSCLMIAFRKGHVKVVKYLVKHVSQLPSDQECQRFIYTINNDPELLKKCHQAMESILKTKEQQALEANKNANSLLEMEAQEKDREANKKAAALKKREKRKRKKREKQLKDQHTPKEDGEKEISKEEEDDDDYEEEPSLPVPEPEPTPVTPPEEKEREKEKRLHDQLSERLIVPDVVKLVEPDDESILVNGSNGQLAGPNKGRNRKGRRCSNKSGQNGRTEIRESNKKKRGAGLGQTGHRDVENECPDPGQRVTSLEVVPSNKSGGRTINIVSPKRNQKKEDGWKQVTRKLPSSGKVKKVAIAATVISRVIGRGGSNINAIRELSGAHIEIDKPKGVGDRIISLRGTPEQTRSAQHYIHMLVTDPEKENELAELVQRPKSASKVQVLHNSMQQPTTAVTTSSTSATVDSLNNITVWNNNMASNIPREKQQSAWSNSSRPNAWLGGSSSTPSPKRGCSTSTNTSAPTKQAVTPPPRLVSAAKLRMATKSSSNSTSVVASKELNAPESASSSAPKVDNKQPGLLRLPPQQQCQLQQLTTSTTTMSTSTPIQEALPTQQSSPVKTVVSQPVYLSEYSHFDSMISSMADLCKPLRDDSPELHSPMNFGSAAGVRVAPDLQQQQQTLSRLPIPSVDPTKAPGYNKPSVSLPEQARAPGYNKPMRPISPEPVRMPTISHYITAERQNYMMHSSPLKDDFLSSRPLPDDYRTIQLDRFNVPAAYLSGPSMNTNGPSYSPVHSNLNPEAPDFYLPRPNIPVMNQASLMNNCGSSPLSLGQQPLSPASHMSPNPSSNMGQLNFGINFASLASLNRQPYNSPTKISPANYSNATATGFNSTQPMTNSSFGPDQEQKYQPQPIGSGRFEMLKKRSEILGVATTPNRSVERNSLWANYPQTQVDAEKWTAAQMLSQMSGRGDATDHTRLPNMLASQFEETFLERQHQALLQANGAYGKASYQQRPHSAGDEPSWRPDISDNKAKSWTNNWPSPPSM